MISEPSIGFPLELVGDSPPMRRVAELIRKAAHARASVLITAERGMDPSVVAREIHARSARSRAPFVVIDCATADPGSVERQLFGGPGSRQPEDLEAVADDSALAASLGGTLFLADVEELPASVQARLARVTRDGEIRLAGLGKLLTLDARLIAGAAPDLDREVADGRFRADLYRRLGALTIDLPPLRQRAHDIPVIAQQLTSELNTPKTLTPAALMLLRALPWRGNIDELRNVMAELIAAVPGDTVQLEDVLAHVRLDATTMALAPNGSLREARARFEREYIQAVLQHHGWRMGAAAEALRIQRPNLYRKVRRLGIPRVKPA